MTFDAVVQDFHVCLTGEHLVVKFLGDDVWEHLLAAGVAEGVEDWSDHL